MKLFLTIFLTIFLAEIGDKTQLATLMFSAKNENRMLVFVAVATALVMATAISVIAGKFLETLIPLRYIRLAGGFLFIILGVLMLTGKF
ncbi:TMEM165/GDT1 family protein [Thermodesulfatator atlanticus]|uniref:TMEM165/GDT1 family protein n=1 Tax=Thermodesulfatator atlanticus TaxID=501497 RepID=UPI0003B541C8|nr:TMEM165/GDT1 family protein [Thermodesulfatator atlanticus]